MMRRGLMLALPALLARPGRAAPSGALQRILQRDALLIGVSPGLPPWSGWDEQGRPDGMAVAVTAWLAADLDVAAEFVALPRPAAIPELTAGRVDILAMQPVTRDALRQCLLSSPYAENSWVVATRPENPATDLAALSGQSIALPLNSPTLAGLHDAMPPGVETLFLEAPLDCLQALIAGQADAAVLPALMLRQHNWRQPEARLRAAFEVARNGIAIAMALGEADLLQTVETFLRLRRFDGLLAGIAHRYLEFPREAQR